MHKRHLLVWMSALAACAFFLPWLLPAILHPVVAAPTLLAVPPRFFILVALLFVALIAAQASGLMRDRGEGARKMGEPPGRLATNLATPLSSIWSGGKAFSSVPVIGVRIRLAGSHYMASPLHQGEAAG